MLSLIALLPLAALAAPRPAAPPRVDASTVQGKVMAGYQGWFRCPGDAWNIGWVHWSRDAKRIAPETLTFEMWPDMREYAPKRRYPAPGFTMPDGKQAELFSSEDYATVRTHFEWMRDHEIDGAWLQRFVVGLPGAPLENQYASFTRVGENVRKAAAATGRVWAIAYDVAAMPIDRTFDVLTADWKRTVDAGVTSDPRYVHEKGLPVALIWGFYRNNRSNFMNPELANRLIDFFKADGPYRAYLIGGGDWDWRRHDDPAWQAYVRRFDAYCIWNIGNYTLDDQKRKHASTQMWEGDREELGKSGVDWIPTVYPGFGWDNLTRQKPGATTIERRKGEFYWEQFVTLARMKQRSVYLAMFDEVDEGTAIFKVSDTPPVEGNFDTLEGMPSDWYLRLTREGIRMLRGRRRVTERIPVRPEAR
jgi:hypothetical protein